MIEYFEKVYSGEPFTIFSTVHIMTLMLLLLLSVALYFLRHFFREPITNRISRHTIAFTLLGSEISLQIWFLSIGVWDSSHSLPLHLSSISLFTSVVMLISKNFTLFEFTYFSGIGSALQAMLTPDLGVYSFPHFRYIHFFISHGGVVLSCLFMIIVEKFRPTFRSIWKAFFLLNLYAGTVYLLNIILQGNYMYLLRKPVNPSLLDYLGPWPLYILSLEGVALIMFLILYLPFSIYYHWKSRNSFLQ
ncbi:YwaF family protein [Bacillus sp. Marseille-P3661]|uniref:YwaF family protein n=1 Tax=Bacillus sp. Marseille-P3661 TaxID=1936234 RepID=UPI000C82EC0A|nr:TIGR02206 family membrane protein [Bacillus sp. Marseille-P3661]